VVQLPARHTVWAGRKAPGNRTLLEVVDLFYHF